MKVQITKETKKWLTLEQAPAARRMIQELKEEEAKYDLETLANAFEAAAPKEYTAEISGNCRIWNFFNDNSGTLDVWINVTLPETYENGKYVIYKVGCYLSDIWQIGSHNRDEIKSHMYIRRFVEA